MKFTLCYLTALLIISLSTTHVSAVERPNILVIIADDLGYGVLNSYGGDAGIVETPNIDRLAAEGAKFTNGYVTCSVCGPSRAGLMTGRYQQRFGIYANCDSQLKDGAVPGDQKMIPKYFKDVGYATAMIGKWHLGTSMPGQHPLDKGFDKYLGFNSAQTDYFRSPILFDGRKKVQSHEYLTREFTNQAMQFVEQSGDAPFFIYLAYNAVHGPNQAPPETVAKFTKLPPNEAVQAAMVSELDSGIGRLLEALDRSGKAGNTMVYFLSDNGGLPYWWEGSHGGLRGFKRYQFEGGEKTPFLVRWPTAIPAGTVISQPVSSLDILPTSLDAAGITPPAGEILDGISLVPAMKSNTNLQPDRPLFWAGSHYEKIVTSKATPGEPKSEHDNPPPAWAVRRGDWKLMQIMEQGEPMLFNIGKDPSESTDVIGQYPDIAAELKQAWVEWFQVGSDPIAWKTEYFEQLKAIR